MTANKLYTLTAYDADGLALTSWEYLRLGAAETIKAALEQGTASVHCAITEQKLETRGQILVRLGEMMHRLPAVSGVAFSSTHSDHLQLSLDRLADVAAWAEELRAVVTTTPTEHARHATASVMWRGWWVTLSALESHAAAVPAGSVDAVAGGGRDDR